MKNQLPKTALLTLFFGGFMILFGITGKIDGANKCHYGKSAPTYCYPSIAK